MTFETRIEKVILLDNERWGTPSDLRVLDDYELCNRYRVLPESGGLYDQDAELIYKFRILDKVFAKKSEIDQKNQAMSERAKQAGGGGS
jgi:hypothetical protein